MFDQKRVAGSGLCRLERRQGQGAHSLGYPTSQASWKLAPIRLFKPPSALRADILPHFISNLGLGSIG